MLKKKKKQGGLFVAVVVGLFFVCKLYSVA